MHTCIPVFSSMDSFACKHSPTCIYIFFRVRSFQSAYPRLCTQVRSFPRPLRMRVTFQSDRELSRACACKCMRVCAHTKVSSFSSISGAKKNFSCFEAGGPVGLSVGWAYRYQDVMIYGRLGSPFRRAPHRYHFFSNM